MSRPSRAPRRPSRRACFLAIAPLLAAPAFAQTTATWLAPVSGTWSDPANWSTNPAFPNDPATDALLAATGSPYTVSLNTPVSLNSLTGTSPDATLNVTTGGTLTLTSSLNLGPGSLTLSGGKIAGGTLASPVAVTSSTSTLNNTTLAAELSFSGGSVTATGTLTLANNASILFNSPTTVTTLTLPGNTLAGTGEVVFDSTAKGSPILLGGTSLTIGPNITVRTGPSLTSPIATIGTNTAPLLNQGTITSQFPGRVLTINTSSLTNTGTIEAKNGGIIRLVGAHTPASVSTVSTSDGGTILFCGSMNATSSTLTLSAGHNMLLGPNGNLRVATITSTDNTPLVVTPYNNNPFASTITGAAVITPVSLLAGTTLTATNTSFSSAVTGTSTNVTLNGAWSLSAPVSLDNSTLTLNGSTASPVGPFSLTNSTLNLNTPVNNTGNTLSLSPTSSLLIGGTPTSTGTYSGAVLTGGTVTGGGTVTLNYPFISYMNRANAAALSNVTLAGDTNLTVASGTTAELRNAFTLGGGRISLVNNGADTLLYLDSLAGSGEIVFDGTSPTLSSVGVRNTAAPFNVPDTFTIRTGTQGGYVLCGTMAGLISAQTPGKVLRFGADKVTGTVEARNGGAISLSTDPGHGVFAPDGFQRVILSGGTWNIYSGSTIDTLNSISAASIVSNAANVTISGSTAVAYIFNSLESNTGSLTFTNGYKTFTSSAAFTNSGSITIGPSSTFKIKGSLSNPGTVTLTAATSALLIDYTGPSPLDSLRNDLLTGHLITSVPGTAIAYFEASQLNLTTYAGFSVDATALLTKVTVPGDANLDGKLNSDDYALIDRAFAQSLTNAHWTDGDFNYDGAITSADYLLIDATLGSQAPLSSEFLSMRESQFGADYVAQLLTSVPEPSSVACLLAGWVSLASRRRRVEK